MIKHNSISRSYVFQRFRVTLVSKFQLSYPYDLYHYLKIQPFIKCLFICKNKWVQTGFHQFQQKWDIHFCMIDIQIQRKTKSSSFQRKTNFLLLQTFVLYFGRGHDIENYHKGLISKRTFISFVLKVIKMITGRMSMCYTKFFKNMLKCIHIM